ncbi:MAG: cytochrome c oxidase subunit 3 [Dehalococcoidales bacterium]|nr:cytochrome c oxidase subunit 3 [Dehalococcoidales bacterium]
MDKSEIRKKLRLGFIVIGFLFIVELTEFLVGVNMPSGAWPILAVLVIPGFTPILYFFMHITQLRRRRIEKKMVTANLTQGEHRLAINRIGLWLFILSESFLFIALIFTRFYLLGVERPAELNQLLGLAISYILLLSSLTAYRAEVAAAYGEKKSFRRNIIFTISLGLLFLMGVGLEWTEAFHFFPPSTLFGTVFFTLTGFHAFHLITGLLALLVILIMDKNGRFTPENYWGVEGAVKYWHFVDVAWVFIFPTLYLVS